VLFDLIKRLDLPGEFSGRAQRIGTRLLEPPTVELAETAVGDIADLVAKSRLQIEQEKRDIEQFLSQLTGRLQEIDRHLGESLGHRERANAEGSAIDASLSAEVAQIHRSVAEAHDFSSLKTSIKTHLENIQAQMQARKELEQSQLELAQAEAARLRETLNRVEGESRQLRERLQDARERALRDALTGLHNRLAYDERIAQELERWNRYARPAVLSIWDIDHFKRINDTFGHTAGDNALRAVAKILQEATRKSDFLARFGGEEFMLLLPETDIATALELADRLRERVATKRFQYRGQPVPLSISCGLATFLEKDSPEDIYRRADIALYRAKAAGRNRCLVFAPDMLEGN
jgi:diguanylate cyclase